MALCPQLLIHRRIVLKEVALSRCSLPLRCSRYALGMRWSIALLLLMGLVACGRATPSPTPLVPTPPPATATPTPAPLALIDQPLLGAPGVTTACDGSPDLDFGCEQTNGHPTLTVALDPSRFARWSLRVDQIGTPLTGDETLALQVRSQGKVVPNLYLVEASGRRVGVPLARYGLQEGEQQLMIPLREIRDDERQWPSFAAVNEVQVVFEWAEMAGTLEILDLHFAAVWQATVPPTPPADELAAGLTLPAGFAAQAIAEQLREVTQLEFTADGALWASLQNGRIWRYTDGDGDGRFETRTLYATGFDEVVGLLYDPVDGGVWIGGRGRLIKTLDRDGNGVADERTVRIDGLPWGRHQNNGLAWNPDPDPFTGEGANQWIYFGLGSTEDLEVGGEWNAQVLRFPRDGQSAADLERISKGNRNAYAVLWAPLPVDLAQPGGPTVWQLFASENGPDFNDAPDEVNHIRWGQDYGFPTQFGLVAGDAVDGEPYSGPVYEVTAHASANGLAYVTNPAWPSAARTLYVSLFGQVFSPGIVGHTVEQVTLTAVDSPSGITYRGAPTTFIAGLDRPLPLTTTLDGDLVVGDYATGVIYRVHYSSEE